MGRKLNYTLRGRSNSILGKKLFTIGETSRIKGISRKALRFYQRIGLLEPRFVNPDNGYRFYSIEQFLHLDIIKAMRVVGISPPDIRACLRKRDTGDLLGFLDEQKRTARARIEELRRSIGTIEGVQDAIRTSRSAVSRAGIYRRRIAERTVATMPFRGISDAGDAVIAFSKLDREIEDRGLTSAYETGILFEETPEGFLPSKIFTTVRDAVQDGAPITTVLPAGEYLCIWYNESSAEERSGKLARYCLKRGLKPRLVIQAELLHDVFAEDSTNVELQMLVEEK